MAKLRRLKRRLLRQVVDDNLATIEGAAGRRRRLPSPWLRRLRRGLLVLLPATAVGASSYVLSTAVSSPEDRIVITQIFEPYSVETLPAEASFSPPLADATVEAEAEPASLPRPEPIAPALLDLAVRKVILDPGHGGANTGTSAPGGMQEKQLTLDVALRLRRMLADQGFEVVLTRDEDRFLELEERTRLANQEAGDIFVSIHVNWIEEREVRGVETYFLGATDDPYLRAIAAAENRDSGYSLADFRSIMEGVYAGVRQDESRRLAEAVQRQLFASLKGVNPALQNRGVKTAPFVVLVSSEMPAVLVEVSCLSNEEETELLTKPLYREYIAQALSSGIRSYADSLSSPTPEPARRSAEGGDPGDSRAPATTVAAFQESP